VTVAAVAPGALRLRAQLRAARRRHRESRAGDLYLALMFLLVYSGLAYRAVSGLGRLLGPAGPVRWWLAGALALALAGLGYRGARLVGPLVAGPAEQAWALSTPVDRGRWLLGPLLVRVGTGVVGGAVLGVGFAVLAGAHPLGWAVAAGAGVGAALVALAGLLQTRHLRRIHPLEWVPAGAGFAGAAAVLVVHARDVALPVPAAMPVPVAVAGLVLAGALTVLAARRLGRVDRAALASGAQIADATATATIFLDPTLLFGVLETRRWRQKGRVRRRPFWSGWSRLPGRRWWLLLAAEARRLARRPDALAVWAALLVVPFAVAVLAPAFAMAARLVAAYFATGRLARGLRIVHASPALRRALGGDDRYLRGVHLVVPAAGLALWWLASAPSVPAQGFPALLLYPAAILFAVYRGATGRPRSYEGGAVDTPFGLIPVALLRQLVRGLDVLAVVVLVALLVG
jgi:hypothetical protein